MRGKGRRISSKASNDDREELEQEQNEREERRKERSRDREPGIQSVASAATYLDGLIWRCRLAHSVLHLPIERRCSSASGENRFTIGRLGKVYAPAAAAGKPFDRRRHFDQGLRFCRSPGGKSGTGTV